MSPGATTDPAHDLLRAADRPALDVFFAPRAVALIGATETPGSVGRTLMRNLIATPFGGTIFPVNPKRRAVLGVKAYPTLAETPDPVDLAVIATPAPTVPDLVAQCVAAGVRGAIILSAGFKEAGADGAALERKVRDRAREGGLRLIGPNCLGIMSPHTGLNATFAQAMARPGSVAFLSQSGALLTAVLDHALREEIGFSAFASLGSMLDIGWGDLIDYLGDDPKTEAIVLYMESVGDDPRAFLSAAREVALTKPILAIKAGRTTSGARAAASHTGALTGSDAVLDAAFDRVGILRVDSLADVFALTETLAKQPRPRGKRLTVLTNAGGPGVLATDALIAGGGQLAALSDATRAALDGFLPPHWSHANPIDILGDAPSDRYAQALAAAVDDPESDGLLAILTPQAMTDPTATAHALAPYARQPDRPVLASWMGGATVAEGARLLAEAGIPTFSYPDEAVRAFNYLWRYSENLRALYETPVRADHDDEDAAGVARLLEEVQSSGRTLLTEAESKNVLAAYGLPTVPTRVARTADDAVAAAEALGYPAVVKLHSYTITHKTDVGGVALNLPDAKAVRAAFSAISERVPAADFQGVTVQPMARLADGYELILGAAPDPQFGPVLLFGAGGPLVEVWQDRALGLPPLTTTLAHRLIAKTRIHTALGGVRGRPPVEEGALAALMVRFARLIAEQPRIREMDINPLLASPEGLLALDARIVLYAAGETGAPPAFRPYPAAYIWQIALRDGASLRLRPVRPEDEPALIRFHESLSARSVALRFFEPLALGARVAHERLLRVAMGDYDREIALAAETEAGEIVAVARLSRRRGKGDAVARFALLVSDTVQNRGLGTALLTRLIEIAQAEGIARLEGQVLPENLPMVRICQKLGFALAAPSGNPPAMAAVKEI